MKCQADAIQWGGGVVAENFRGLNKSPRDSVVAGIFRGLSKSRRDSVGGGVVAEMFR